jgi:hypothetical protein
MQDIYTTTSKAKAQLALGSTISSLSSYGSNISQRIATSTGKPGRVFAHIKETVKRRRLKKAQDGTEGGLRAHYIAQERNSRGRKRPVVSAPMIQPQQLTFVPEPCSGDTQMSSQKRIRRNRLAYQHEALRSHPVHINRENQGHEQSHIASTAPWRRSLECAPYHEGIPNSSKTNTTDWQRPCYIYSMK